MSSPILIKNRIIAVKIRALIPYFAINRRIMLFMVNSKRVDIILGVEFDILYFAIK